MIGKTVSHYHIVEKIGAGGMGDVFKAEDTKLDRFAALKFLPYHLSRSEDEKKRFIHEAKAASALDHNNICTIYEINETDEQQLFIAMAYYEGRSLREILADGPLALEEAVSIGIQILEGITAAHRREIIHRDIKPANILITDEGVVKIVDFGLAKLSGRTQLTKEGSTLGTVNYMSPEQARGEEVDARADLWSFGIVFYEMLSGKKPFPGDYEHAVLYAILNEAPQPIPGLPAPLQELITRSLEKDPGKRFDSAEEMLRILRDFRSRRKGEGQKGIGWKQLIRIARRPRIFIPAAIIIILVIYLGIQYFSRQSEIAQAENVLLPQLEQLVGNSWRDFTEAYRLAEKIEAVIPDNPRLKQLISGSSFRINATTDPPGAKVFVKDYQTPEAAWLFLGESPVDSARLPIGVLRWKFEKEGYEPVLAVSSTWNVDIVKAQPVPFDISRILDHRGDIPENMVRVAGAETPAGEIPDFFIDRCEVTNKQFRKFIDSGGYRNRAYWQHSFIQDGKELSWEEAMAVFADMTGQPGPANWQAGNYPADQADFPVSGISWYEAAAYAEYCGKSLPTGTHWDLARGVMTPLIRWPQLGGFAVFAPFSNFGSKGPVAVGSMPGATAYGAFDMAGNVREWCWNDTKAGKLIRGGAWNDNTYMFSAKSQAPAIDRSVKNGFRCAVYANRNKLPPAVFAAEALPPVPDFDKEKPVSDDIYKIYTEQFAYDPARLNTREESRSENQSGWMHETVSFDAAYGDDRIIAHLFLPENITPPYQCVVYFPGSAALFQKSSRELEKYYEFTVFTEFIVRNGRALMFPVYQGTFERAGMKYIPLHQGGTSHSHTEFRIQLVKDFRRCIDYLYTRDDIDSGRIAYYGMSWGGIYGAIIPAVEPRIKTAVILSGGLLANSRPEVNQLNYITRIKMPVLMLNGRYDTNLEAAIMPMYQLLGTRKEDKKLMLFDSDHIVPRIDFVRETLSWLDKYMGPVRWKE